MSSTGPAHGPPRWIVLDDLDSSINYEGDSWYTASDSKENFEEWDNAGFGLTYLGTLHGTDSDAKMSFSFDGSAVVLTGSNNPLNESGVVTPSYECFMDGVKFGEQTTFAFPANNWDICNWSSEDGSGGNHTLSVEVKTDGQSFYADRIKYIPTPGSKAAMQLGGGDNPENVVELTRNDLGIKLGSGWGTLGDTANVTQRTGAKAEINFFGSKLSWWAFIPGEFAKSPTTGSYQIDDENPISFTLRGLQPNQPTTYNQMLFQTPSLSRGPHKMVVTYNGGQGVTPLPLTHLLVTNGNATVPVEGDPTVFDLASMATANPSPSGTGKPGGGGSDNSEEGGGTNVGAIAGGVVGGLVIIAAAVFALFFLRRRKQRRQSIDIDNPVVVPYSPQNNSRPLMSEVHSNDPHHGGAENSAYGGSSAYAGSSGYGGGNSAVSPSSYSNANTFSTNSGYQNAGAAVSNKTAHRAGQPSMSSSDAHQSSASSGVSAAAALVPRRKGDVVPEGSTTSREQPSGSRVMLHQDSGVRLNGQEEEEPVEELPPVYTAR